MNQDSKPHNPFSLIADFDGDIRDLFAHRHDGELPILPLRNLVLFPGVVTTVTIGRESSMALIRHITNQTDDEGFPPRRPPVLPLQNSPHRRFDW